MTVTIILIFQDGGEVIALRRSSVIYLQNENVSPEYVALKQITIIHTYVFVQTEREACLVIIHRL